MKQTNTPTERAAGVWKAIATLRKRLDKYADRLRQDITTTDIEQAETLCREVEEISEAVSELSGKLHPLFEEANQASLNAIYFEKGKRAERMAERAEGLINSFGEKKPDP